MAEIKRIRPQEGYQMKSLSSPADIIIGGGAAGVGKTFCLLLEPLRHINVKNFGGVIFRRTSPQIRAEGGLWDASSKIYNLIQGARPKESSLEWMLADSVKLKFSHLEYEKNVFDWQGSEIPFIGFDELTHFTKKMFFYLLSRNRSTCGIRPYVRATCNPDPDSWVAELVDWWIGEDGYPIEERQGKVRYFLVDKSSYIWGDSYEEVINKARHVIDPMVEQSGINPKEFIKSLTFIGGSIYDNKELLDVDPGYLGNLNSQDEETKRQLLQGNWKVKISDIDIYDYYKFSDIFTNTHVQRGEKRITADIAMKGSNKFVAFVWAGRVLIDFVVMAKSKGNEVISAIKDLAEKHGVMYSNILFDNDGVGQFVDGFIEGAREFNNGSRALNDENYNHLKAQCYYRSGDSVSRGEYHIPEEVANRMYDDKMTFKQRLMYERKAIKRDKPDNDGRLRVLPKQEMVVFLNGESPDLMDAFMENEWFEIKEFKRMFRSSYIKNLYSSVRTPILIGDLIGNKKTGKESLENVEIKVSEGDFNVWREVNDPPLPDGKVMKDRYCVYVKFGGRNDHSSYSAISVFDRYWMSQDGYPERVATWRGKIDQDFVAWKAAQVATYYDNGLLAFEIVTGAKESIGSEGLHHLTLLNEISDHYRNLYRETDPEKIVEGAPTKWGFDASLGNQSMLTNNFNAMIRDRTYIEHDEIVPRQAENFEEKPDGTFGAIDGQHSDVLRTTMGGLWMCTQYMRPPIIEDKVSSRPELPIQTKKSLASY